MHLNSSQGRYILKMYEIQILAEEMQFKDARSVSLYPYIQSQILQNVKYTN